MIVIALLIVVACVVLLYLGVEKFTQTTEATRCHHKDCFTRRNRDEKEGQGWPCTRPVKIKNSCAKGKNRKRKIVPYPSSESPESDFERVQPKRKRATKKPDVEVLRGLMLQQDRIAAALEQQTTVEDQTQSGLTRDDPIEIDSDKEQQQLPRVSRAGIVEALNEDLDSCDNILRSIYGPGNQPSSSRQKIPSPPREMIFPGEMGLLDKFEVYYARASQMIVENMATILERHSIPACP